MGGSTPRFLHSFAFRASSCRCLLLHRLRAVELPRHSAVRQLSPCLLPQVDKPMGQQDPGCVWYAANTVGPPREVHVPSGLGIVAVLCRVSALIEARHLALHKVPTSKRIWMRVSDPSTARLKWWRFRLFSSLCRNPQTFPLCVMPLMHVQMGILSG